MCIVYTRAGYEFLGWSNSSAAESARYIGGESMKLASDLTLYAVWRQIEVGLAVSDWTVEVLDRRTPAEPAPSWETALTYLRAVVTDKDGQTVEGVTFSSTDYASVDFRKLGDYPIVVTATLASGETLTADAVITVVDTTPPEIYVKHPTIMFLRAPQSMAEILARAVISADDNYDETVTLITLLEDQSLVQGRFEDMDWVMGRDYVLLVNATDSSGNKAIQRTVTIRLRTGEGEGLPEGGGTIITDDDGNMIVIDEDGVPLGQYVTDEDGNLVFIPITETPLADFGKETLPQTGNAHDAIALIAAALGLLSLSVGAILSKDTKRKEQEI